MFGLTVNNCFHLRHIKDKEKKKKMSERVLN